MATPKRDRLGRFERLFQPVDGASLAVLRMLFGAIIVFDVVRYWSKGWISAKFLEPAFLFKFQGFEWVHPWPGDGLYWHFAALGVAAACVAIGALYRVAAVAVFLSFSYIFLLDQAQYLNHFYLVILYSFLMIFLPANRVWSVDAWLSSRRRRTAIPAVAIWTLRAQMEVILIYAGLVKTNVDWLRLEPLRSWLAVRTDFPLGGSLFTEDWVVALGAYGVILLHVAGAPLLLWRRTRIFVFALYCAFHVVNHFMFKIGIFPWFTIAGTLMFFDPDWPRQVARRGAAIAARLGMARTQALSGASARSDPVAFLSPRARQTVLCGLALWFAVQIALPLRHHLYPGRPSWTEEGHRFAWRMKLRDKRGRAHFQVRDPATGRVWHIHNPDYLTRRQIRKMVRSAELLILFARRLEQIWAREKGVPNVEVRARVMVSLNGRLPALLIDPNGDLTKAKWDIWPSDLVLPLTEPLRRLKTTAGLKGNSGSHR